MKISLEWLKEYVDYNGSVEQLEEIFTNVGFPVEGRLRVGDDWMLDVEVTSNRPDCLGHIGLAREVAAVTGATFRMPEVSFTEHGRDVCEWTSVQNDAPRYCSRYTARIIDGVQAGSSPDWMRRRLETIGLRGISNVVDITNYVLMEIGQPLHSFDFARLCEGRIVVRTSLPGERMEMIDHSKIELKEDMLVIADATAPVALAGVMGGLASEVGDETRTVLLESAHFAPLSIRRTSRSLTLASESSFRFERNVDMEMLEWASRRAAGLLAELAGGKVAPGVIDVATGAAEKENVQMRMSRLKKLVGIAYDSEFVLGLFERLGLNPRYDGSDVITCTIPSWRGDLTREVDLIEEVIRIHGYGNVPTEPKIHITVKTADAYQRIRGKVGTLLNGCGFFETINVSFVEERYLKLFAEEGFEPVRVKDLSRRSNNALRASLLGSLVNARKRNQDAGNGRCDFYEIAAVHCPSDDGEELPRETIKLGLITDGGFRYLRGVIEAMLGGLDRTAKLKCTPAKVLWAEDGTGAELVINGQVVGRAGQAGGNVIDVFDLSNGVCLAEIDFEYLVQLEERTARLEPIMRFPAVTRDLSLILDENVTWAGIEAAIWDLAPEDLRELRFVGVYRGAGVEPGRKSLTLSMVFRRADETLRHEQVDEYQEKILATLREKFQAKLRA
ncbi:MAG: phenylalanine--tRNA ligase subunit beta [Sedimentisphaerales bacterium]|nr:phenylalanine--tRNA ligase subunit beta [Sedimentisphaerales bacterium]